MRLHALLASLFLLLLIHARTSHHQLGEGVNGTTDGHHPKRTHHGQFTGPGAAAPTPTPRANAARAGRATRSRNLAGPGTGSLLDWHALAMCESTDNPRAVSPSGRSRGLYQFDLTTWRSRSVGGHGDPINASRAEQTLRAQRLYADRGRAPWPVCGRYL